MTKLKNWHRRLIILFLSLLFVASGLFLALKTFSENIVFFVTPTEFKAQEKKYSNKLIRLGGIVKVGSIKNISSDHSIEFIITDLKNEVVVRYKGAVPALFKEDSGTVVQGKVKDNIFYAQELLAKHDENYMPKEVVDELKKSGRWKENSIKYPEDDPDLLNKPPHDICN